MHFKLNIDLNRHRHVVLAVFWCAVMWMASRWLEIPSVEVRAAYSFILWFVTSLVGLVVILHFCRPRD